MEDGQEPDFLTRSGNYEIICWNVWLKITRRVC